MLHGMINNNLNKMTACNMYNLISEITVLLNQTCIRILF